MRFVGILLFILLSAAACSGESPAAGQAVPTSTPIPTAPAVARPTYLVQRGDVQETLKFSGRWLPRDQVSLSFEIAGTVRRVNVQRGDAVTAGQLLADLQIAELEAQLATAQLELDTAIANLSSGSEGAVQTVADAQVTLANARLQLESARSTSPWPQLQTAENNLADSRDNLANAQRVYDDAISRPDQPASVVDQAYANLQDARTRLSNAEASYYQAAQQFNDHELTIAQRENAVLAAELALQQAQQGGGDPSREQAVRAAQLRIDQINADITRSSLYSPVDGEVLEISIQPGDAVEAFRVVMIVGRPEPREMIANLALTDAQRLAVGAVGVCNVINQPETAVGCVVRRLPLSANDADQTVRVAATLPEVPSGQIIEAAMPLQVRQNVLWLPPAAIRTFQNRTFVVLQTPDGERAVDIQIGLRTTERVEIISGVNEGDQVIAP